MGEIADMMLERYGWDDDGPEPAKPDDYLKLTDDELRKLTAAARSEKLKSIRAWPSPLSEKQRWCLAAWIAEKENRFA